MRTTVIFSLAILLLMAFIVACGGASEPEEGQTTTAQETTTTTTDQTTETQATESAETTTSETTTQTQAQGEQEQQQQASTDSKPAGETPEAAMEEDEETDGDAMMEGDAMWEASDELKAYAAEKAGGPGAIYIGDGNFDALVGPSVYDEFAATYGTDLGDDDGNVPLDAILDVKWVFESDYYRQLIEKANLTNPTPLTSSGEDIELQHTCINGQLLWCKHQRVYFVPNVQERTEEQVTLNITSFPELGLAGTDTASLLADGTLGMTEIYGGYVGGEFPTLAVQYIWGLWPDHETHYRVLTNIAPDLDQVIKDELDAQVLMRNWIAGDDQFFFSNQRLETPEDFQGLKTRSHSSELSDWINHMGAAAQFMAFAEVYTALERGVIDAAVTGANPGLSQRFYEVAEYMNGRLFSFNSTTNVVNGDVWDSIPADIQQIMLEEGAKYELEALRLTAIHNVTGITRNTEAGLELVEFGPEAQALSKRAAAESVLPNWLQRLGYPDEGQNVVDVFNEKIGPFVGLEVQRDESAERGFSVIDVPITQGIHAQ